MKLNFFSKRMGIIVISIIVIVAIVMIFFMFEGRIKMFVKARYNSCAGLNGEAPKAIVNQYICEGENRSALVWVTGPKGTLESYGKDGVYPCCVPMGVVR